MKADDLIDNYVYDVTKLLPRKQRRDVAMELRALLHDEVNAKAGPSNREEAALAVLRGFGPPAEVATRYGSPVTLIDPSDTLWFMRLAIGGIGLILAGVVVRLVQQETENRLIDGGIARWGPQAWQQLFAWLGFLVAVFAVTAWVRRRWPQTTVWKPKEVIAGKMNRTGRTVAIVFWVAGTLILVSPGWYLEKIFGNSTAWDAREAFTYDEEFLRLRGPVLLGLLCLAIAFQIVQLVQGQRTPAMSKAEFGLGLVMSAVAIWILAAGPIFRAQAANEGMRAGVALILLFTVIDAVVRSRRYRAKRDKPV